MTTVFLGGSRNVTRLNDVIRTRLDELMDRRLTIYVGDASGADRAMQRYLAAAEYDQVVVFAVKSRLRHNEGGWDVRYIEPPHGARGFDLYATKDRAMAQSADAGLMLWDGKSRGTFENLRSLLESGKPIALYLAPRKRFLNIRSSADLEELLPDLGDQGRSHDGGFRGESEQFDLLTPSGEGAGNRKGR